MLDASYRRWPMASPRLNAFWRIAPGVRFIAFEILTTGVLLFECALRSRTCSFVQATRLVRLAIKFILFERLSLSTSQRHDKHFKAPGLYHTITDKSARAPPARFHNFSFCESCQRRADSITFSCRGCSPDAPFAKIETLTIEQLIRPVTKL